MAANRKKGKKPQNSNQGKTSNKSLATETAELASDNTGGAVADAVSVDWEAGALEPSSTPASSPASPAAEAAPAPVEAVSSEIFGEATTSESEANSVVAETEPVALTETAAAADANVNKSPVVASAQTSETPLSSEKPEVATQDSSAIKLSESAAQDTAAPESVATADPPKVDVNFGKDEIRTLLVPVNPFNRLVACIIVIFASSILGYIILKTPAGLNAQGMHTIDLPEAGAYVFFFRGNTEDPYGWTKGGRFRESLVIDMDPVESFQRVQKIEPIKDLSGAGFFSVAEFEVNQPGKYNVWIKWNDPNAKCIGKIKYEKDPVESFFFKWALGIVGTIAFFYMIGIPMTTRKAQSTLPNSSPPVVTK